MSSSSAPEKNSSRQKDTDKNAKGQKDADKKSSGLRAKLESTGKQISGIVDKIPRPRQKRFVFFAAFLALCISMVASYDTCDMKKRSKNDKALKKEDCGYAGILPLECKTTACFTKDGGKMQKLKITVNRTKGTKLGLTFEKQSKKHGFFVETFYWMLGLKLDKPSKKKDFVIESIQDGPVNDHNRLSEEQLLRQDVVVSVDGSTDIAAALKKTDSKRVTFDIRRSKLPSFLRWLLHRSGKPGLIEKVWTAPLFREWFSTSSHIAGVGVIFWFFSGYPLASLPVYYLGLSGVVGWHLNKCCHDQDVPPNTPHCYKGARATGPVALGRAWEYASEKISKMNKDPRKYLKWAFVPPKF